MADFNTLNLNAFYTANNSPLVTRENMVSAYDFDAYNERGAVTTTKVQFVTADKIAAGTVQVAMNLGTNIGSAYILLDGANNRIIINDGTTDRILMGYDSGGF